MQGCVDVVAPIHLDDAKAAWDPEAFAPHIMDPLGKDNFYQMHGYLWLWGREWGWISRMLVNCPDMIIQNELKRLLFNMDVATDESPEYKEAAADLMKNLIFDDIPLEERVIRKKVERDQNILDQIPGKVVKARKFLQEMDDKHKSYSFRKPMFIEIPKPHKEVIQADDPNALKI